jgi:hypothetical protein
VSAIIAIGFIATLVIAIAFDHDGRRDDNWGQTSMPRIPPRGDRHTPTTPATRIYDWETNDV